VSGGRRGSSNYAALIARNHEYLDTAEVVIAPAVGRSRRCLEFYYCLTSPWYNARMSVTAGGTEVWGSRWTSPGWNKASINLTGMTGSTEVKIVARNGRWTSNDLPLDDVVMRAGPCV